MVTFTVILYIWGKPPLVAHICCVLTVLLLDDTSQSLIQLRPHTQGITEGLRPYRKYHELLHGQSVTSVRAPVDHIERLRGRGQGGRGAQGESVSVYCCLRSSLGAKVKRVKAKYLLDFLPLIGAHA